MTVNHLETLITIQNILILALKKDQNLNKLCTNIFNKQTIYNTCYPYILLLINNYEYINYTFSNSSNLKASIACYTYNSDSTIQTLFGITTLANKIIVNSLSELEKDNLVHKILPHKGNFTQNKNKELIFTSYFNILIQS